jgi:hypothetical protein
MLSKVVKSQRLQRLTMWGDDILRADWQSALRSYVSRSI